MRQTFPHISAKELGANEPAFVRDAGDADPEALRVRTVPKRDGKPMTIRHCLGDREPEPAALGARRRRPKETVEQTRDVRLGDAATGIDHIEHEAVTVQPQ